MGGPGGFSGSLASYAIRVLSRREVSTNASLSPLTQPLSSGFCISLGNFGCILLVFLLLETILGVYGFHTYGFTASIST